MPQLQEDEWPTNNAETTTEREHLKDDVPDPHPDGPHVDDDGEPEVPPELAEKMTPPVPPEE